VTPEFKEYATPAMPLSTHMSLQYIPHQTCRMANMCNMQLSRETAKVAIAVQIFIFEIVKVKLSLPSRRIGLVT
jgi:hypothetical protein